MAPCAPVQSRHATSSLAACFPFPVCQSLARMSLAVYSRCEVDILHFPLLHAALHSAHGARLVSKQLASPERRLFSAWLREGHWPPEHKLSSVARGEWRSGLPAVPVPDLRVYAQAQRDTPGASAATCLYACLKIMLGTLSWYMRPTKGSTSHPAPAKPGGWCALPEVIVFVALHRSLPSHAPNRQGCPSGLKHQEGLVFPSSPQGVSKGFPSSPRDKG